MNAPQLVKKKSYELVFHWTVINMDQIRLDENSCGPGAFYHLYIWWHTEVGLFPV